MAFSCTQLAHSLNARARHSGRLTQSVGGPPGGHHCAIAATARQASHGGPASTGPGATGGGLGPHKGRQERVSPHTQTNKTGQKHCVISRETQEAMKIVRLNKNTLPPVPTRLLPTARHHCCPLMRPEGALGSLLGCYGVSQREIFAFFFLRHRGYSLTFALSAHFPPHGSTCISGDCGAQCDCFVEFLGLSQKFSLFCRKVVLVSVRETERNFVKFLQKNWYLSPKSNPKNHGQ